MKSRNERHEWRIQEFGINFANDLRARELRTSASQRLHPLWCGCCDPDTSYHRNVCSNGFPL